MTPGRPTGGITSNVRAVRLVWTGRGLEFQGGGTEPPTPAITIDGDGESGPSPMIALLLAAAGCSCADVVSILKKGRVNLEECIAEVSGVRRDADPRRYVSLHFKFRLRGAGLDAAKAERAVQLSLEKYCSVVHSLAPDIATDYEIQLA